MDNKALKRRRRRKIKITVFLVLLLAVVPGLYVWLYWDYHVSWYLFDRYCNDEDVAGLHVYERVGLDKSYFRPRSEVTEENLAGDIGYLPDAGLFLDLERLKEDYAYDLGSFSEISEIGPIAMLRSTITRRSDNTLLGEFRNYRNIQGETAWLIALGNSSVFCTFPDELGYWSRTLSHYHELFIGVFYYED